MTFQAVKLLWILAAVSYHITARCTLHQLEDIKQESVATNVEKINFNQIIKSLLELVITTEKSKFSRIKENFILGTGQICERAAKGLTLENARSLQGQGFTNPIYLALKFINGDLLVYDHDSKSALLLHEDEVIILLENYGVEMIEQGTDNDLYLQDNKIKVNNRYICQASTLLIQNGQQVDELIENIYYKIKQLFEINNILVDIISKDLHQCCSTSTESPNSDSCLFVDWSPEIRMCFKKWSTLLERNIRNPGVGEIISWAVGEGQQISQVSRTMKTALGEYNTNFQNLGKHELKMDYNINSLTKITENITRYEQALHTNNLISSVLSQQNFKRLFHSLKMSNDLKELNDILEKAGINQLLINLSNALLKTNPRCVIRDNQCITFRYLTQAADQNSVLLHEVSSRLSRTLSAIVVCLPQLGKLNWIISNLNKQKFSLENNTLISENRVIPIGLLSNETYLNSTMRGLMESETNLRDFVIFSQEMDGVEKFQLMCLNSTLFNLNGEHRRCSQNELLELPSSNWVLKNGFGTFSHYHHNFHLKQLHQTNTSWEDLTDDLLTPEIEINKPELQPIDTETEISWITDDAGSISNEGHYMFYSLCGSAIFIVFIVVCFHSEMKRICNYII